MDEEAKKAAKQQLKKKQNDLWHPFDSDYIPPAELLHFTCPSAFRNIIQSGELWCTDFAQVNDPDEGAHGMDIVRQLARKKSVPSFFRNLLGKGNFGMKDTWTEFVMCFCCGGELNYMWSNYACNSTGCAIGFDYHKLFADAPGKYALYRMLYDRATQVELLAKTFDHAIHYAREIGIGNRDMRTYWLELVVRPLLHCASRFKDLHWSGEKEMRLAVWGGEHSFEKGGKRRISVPFDASAVTKIIRGTAAGADLSIERVRTLLNAHGYSNNLPILDACQV